MACNKEYTLTHTTRVRPVDIHSLTSSENLSGVYLIIWPQTSRDSEYHGNSPPTSAYAITPIDHRSHARPCPSTFKTLIWNKGRRHKSRLGVRCCCCSFAPGPERRGVEWGDTVLVLLVASVKKIPKNSDVQAGEKNCPSCGGRFGSRNQRSQK